MMLYYTGADNLNLPQNNPNKSLGGYISTSPIPNGRLNNIFNDESYDDATEGSVNIRAVVLRNTTLLSKTNVTVQLEYDTTKFKLEVAFATVVDGVMEKITDQSDRPYYANFMDTTDPITIGDLNPNDMMAIWLRRTLLPNIDTFDSSVITSTNSFNLKINWA